MKFDIFTQDITIEEIKNSDGVNFINELGLEGDALKQALENYFEKSVLAFAKDSSLFTVGEEMVLYLDRNKEANEYSIVVRKQFEDKIASLIISLDAETMTVTATINGASKTKTYEKEAKIADVVKAFNAVIKSIQK